MMNFETFKEKVIALKSVTSVRKVTYTLYGVTDDVLTFERESTNKVETLNLSELYQFYSQEQEYNTIIARNYMSKLVYSPAVAILRTLTKTNRSI